MNCEHVTNHIIGWLKDQINRTKQKGFVVGVSGGVDSAVTSTLCAGTGLPVICLNMPIHQLNNQYNQSEEHIHWLKNKFKNIESYTIDLTDTFDSLEKTLPNGTINELALANSRSRIRMVTLYAFANSRNYIVVGTGNKVEDYGIGFFTKYGDGGVDISPIGDLMKSEIYQLAEYLGIINSIIKAEPNDGLWGDGRTDEEQIGATYKELEWAMKYYEEDGNVSTVGLSEIQKEVIDIYLYRHNANKHKLSPPVICELSNIK